MPKTPKPVHFWCVDTGEEAAQIQARTKSEARAIAKKDFGYARRLPVGTYIARYAELSLLTR